MLLPTLNKPSYTLLYALLKPIDVLIEWGQSLVNYLTNGSGTAVNLSELLKDMLEWHSDEYAVSLLTNFITAHTYAQAKVYLSDVHVVASNRRLLTVDY